MIMSRSKGKSKKPTVNSLKVKNDEVKSNELETDNSFMICNDYFQIIGSNFVYRLIRINPPKLKTPLLSPGLKVSDVIREVKNGATIRPNIVIALGPIECESESEYCTDISVLVNIRFLFVP